VARPPRVTRRRATTRARLLDAAFEVFATQGFGQASIEGVCEAAGYTRGAFYSNFGSLDELFFALYEQRSELLATQVAETLGEPVEGETIASLIKRVVAALMVDRDWILVTTEFFLYAARTPAAAIALATYRAKLHSALARTLSGAIDRTALPPSLRTPEGLASAVMAVHNGATTRLLLEPAMELFETWLAELLTALLDHPSPGSTERAQGGMA
jgi:AcrR family transcriptional regulator